MTERDTKKLEEFSEKCNAAFMQLFELAKHKALFAIDVEA